MATSVTQCYYDKSKLSQSVYTIHSPAKSLVHCFSLRTRINIGNYRIFFGRIEIKRLVHNTIKICNPIISLGCEKFRKLISCLHER